MTPAPYNHMQASPTLQCLPCQSVLMVEVVEQDGSKMDGYRVPMPGIDMQTCNGDDVEAACHFVQALLHSSASHNIHLGLSLVAKTARASSGLIDRSTASPMPAPPASTQTIRRRILMSCLCSSCLAQNSCKSPAFRDFDETLELTPPPASPPAVSCLVGTSVALVRCRCTAPKKVTKWSSPHLLPYLPKSTES